MTRNDATALTFGATSLALTCWTVVPAPNLPLLILGVVEAEFAAWATLVTLFITALALRISSPKVRTLVLALLLAADACAAWPIVVAPLVARAAGAQLAAADVPAQRPGPAYAVDLEPALPVRLRDGATLSLDLYHPAGVARAPLLIMIYGGGWTSGQPSDLQSLARWYAQRGYAVAAIDYRHAPQFRFPTQLHDVEDALATIATHAAAWHVDATRVALFGRSAGGQLALLAGERAQPVRVRALVAYYAPTDLAGGYRDPPRPDPAAVRGLLANYLGGPPVRERAAAYAAASPITNATAAMPPVYLIIGVRDELVLVRFQREFAARLTALGVRNVALEIPWSNHAFDQADGLGAALARSTTLRFLDAALQR